MRGQLARRLPANDCAPYGIQRYHLEATCAKQASEDVHQSEGQCRQLVKQEYGCELFQNGRLACHKRSKENAPQPPVRFSCLTSSLSWHDTMIHQKLAMNISIYQLDVMILLIVSS